MLHTSPSGWGVGVGYPSAQGRPPATCPDTPWSTLYGAGLGESETYAITPTRRTPPQPCHHCAATTAPCNAITPPHNTAQHHTTPYHTAPHRTTPHPTAPHRTTPHHTTPHRTKPNHTIPYHTTPHHTTPNHTDPYLIPSYLTSPLSHPIPPHPIPSHSPQVDHQD